MIQVHKLGLRQYSSNRHLYQKKQNPITQNFEPVTISNISEKHGSMLRHHSKISFGTDELSHNYTQNMNKSKIVEDDHMDAD